MEDFNLDIKPGEKLALSVARGGQVDVGYLLLRFYDVEKGAITIDGQDISQVQQDTLRANIGMVTQDTSLLHRSVRDNILYGRPDATEEELLLAVKRALQ